MKTIWLRILGSLWLPLSLAVILTVTLIFLISGKAATVSAATEPVLITIEPGTFTYRLDGAYLRNGVPVDAPLITVTRDRPLRISKYQVTNGQYGECVAAGACKPADTQGGSDYPVVGVSHDDALAYAEWLSSSTGSSWSLPSDEDTAFAAGSWFPDDATGLDPNNANPALRWIADYDREAAIKRRRDPHTRPSGGYSANEHGLADFGGNVWEWTTTCDRRVDSVRGSRDRANGPCGVFVAVGSHRSPTSSFIRDPKGGGCSVGTPPDNLGFRVVSVLD